MNAAARPGFAGATAMMIALGAAACASSTHPAVTPRIEAIQETPEGVVDAFAAALRAGDVPALRRLMAPNVVIAESGGVERSFDEYAVAHMPADIAFTRGVEFTLEHRDSIVDRDMATVISRAQVQGQFNGRPIHSNSMETMVLQHMDGNWRIVHIHWSSSPIAERE